MRIAVLIPVYNAAEFLPQCLESVLAQDVRGLEVYCCDDGSTDDSLKILREAASRNSNVHFSSQSNAGVVATRNRLLDELPQDFDAVAFVDADDCLAPGMYAKLSEALERTESDIAECEWEGRERIIDDCSVYRLKRTAPGHWIVVWNKLYRRSAVGSVRFRDGLSFEEDYFFNYEVHAAIRRKVLVPGHYYDYRINPTSATGNLSHRRYFASTSNRIRLSLDVFQNAGRIPPELIPVWREELAKDAYRMCIRKNLKKNDDADLRRELFHAAGQFFRTLETESGFSPVGLNVLQGAIYRCCLSGRYRLARLLTALT